MPPRDELKALFDRGRTLDQIAVHYGVAKITVGRWKRKHGLQLPTPQERRIPVPPPSQLSAFRSMGETHVDIARRLGCSAKTVAKMLRAEGLATDRRRRTVVLDPKVFSDPFNLTRNT